MFVRCLDSTARPAARAARCQVIEVLSGRGGRALGKPRHVESPVEWRVRHSAFRSGCEEWAAVRSTPESEEATFMDDVRRAFYRPRFREALLDRKGKAFEDWFTRLAEFALGSDFERVRPYGAEGDSKTDARTRSDRTIYQCYAPETLSRDRLIAKMNDDFTGAVANWPNWIRRWVFVHNDLRGLAKAIYDHQDALRSMHPSVEIEIWGEAALTRLADRMDLSGWETMFGVVPSRNDVEALAPDDVAEVIRYLEREEPSPEGETVRAPSVDKIAKNALSGDVLRLLKVGQQKDHLVRRFFESHPRPHVGDNIAEAFRLRYRELRDAGQPPDDIFAGLQRATGERGSPKRQVAALAVLSYLFDRCDIFEDPDDQP